MSLRRLMTLFACLALLTLMIAPAPALAERDEPFALPWDNTNVSSSTTTNTSVDYVAPATTTTTTTTTTAAATSGIVTKGFYNIALIGDSLTEDKLQPYLEPMLASGYSNGSHFPGHGYVYDYGKGGYQTGEIYDYITGINAPKDQWDYVFIMAGTNDLVHAYNNDEDINSVAARATANIQAMINYISDYYGSSYRPRITVAAIPPTLSTGRTSYTMEYNNYLYSHLTGYDLFITSNFYDLYDASAGTAYSSIFKDYLHPDENHPAGNTNGYYIMAENYFWALDAYYTSNLHDSYTYKTAWYGGN